MNGNRVGPRRGTQLTLLLIVLIMLIISGYFVASYFGQFFQISSKSEVTPTPFPAPIMTSAASDVRALLTATELSKNVLAEEVAKTDNTKESHFSLLEEEVLSHGRELSLVYGRVYGPLAQEQALALWEKHIPHIVDLAIAAKQGDQKSKKTIIAQLEKDIDAFTREMGTYNSDLPVAAVQVVMDEYLHGVTHLIDAQDPTLAAEGSENDGAIHTQEEIVEASNAINGKRVSFSEMHGDTQSFINADEMSPNTIVIAEQRSVYLYNQDAQAHEFWMGKGNDYGKEHDHQIAPEYFKTEALAPQETYEMTFTASGLYFLHDHNNPDIYVTVLVYMPNDSAGSNNK